MSAEFTQKLLAWNAAVNDRQMPWKGQADAYKIWISEIILQQTTVGQGTAYYDRFISAFPTVFDLAAAPEQTVYKLWEGLGYYSRCTNLIHSAKVIVSDFHGEFPRSYDDILSLRGIGPYTAAAIASFAFGECRAVVDGNVQRVIARYFGISTPVGAMAGKKLYQQLAQAMIDPDMPGIYNQAIMDFGAIVCKPRNPLCSECVQADECEALKHGFTRTLPVKEKNPPKKLRWLHYFMVECGDYIYVRKRITKDIWQNLYEFVLLETDGPETDPAFPFLHRLLNKTPYAVKYSSPEFTQALTHQRIYGRFIMVAIPSPSPPLTGYQLIRKDQMEKLPFPEFINNFLENGLPL